jgi:hypothetical protein
MKLEFSGQIFEKYSNIKLHENRPVGSELFHADGETDGQTERHSEANSCFSQFANTPNKTIALNLNEVTKL